jgi:hypothetical protein
LALSRTQLVSPNCVVTDSDYDAIESAIMESSRGRWFLSEYARRNRQADTNLILSAINNIKDTVERIKRASNPYPVKSIKLSSTFLAPQRDRLACLPRVVQSIPEFGDQEHSNSETNGVTETGISARSNVSHQRGQPPCDDLDTFLFK